MKLRNIINKISSDMKEINRIANEDSYYPELKRKSRIKRKSDLMFQYFKYRYPNKFYNLYGLDVQNSEGSNYLDYELFMRVRNQRNNESPFSYTVILRDKMLFSLFFSLTNVETIKNDALILNGNTSQLSTLSDGDYFIKKVDGEMGDGVFLIAKVKDQFFYKSENIILSDLVKNDSFVVQSRLIQHKLLTNLNKTSVNTIRIVTVRKKNDVVLLSAVLRVGAPNEDVDNWAKGGGICGNRQ